MTIFMRNAVLMLAMLLAGCGTTTNIQPSPQPGDAAVPVPQGAPAADFSAYDSVVVLDFVAATDKAKIKPDKLQSYTDTLNTAVRTFADLIAQKIRETGAFNEVARGPTTGNALTVTGRITRLVEGSAGLRFFIGMGAGSSYFDATIDLADAETNVNLGQIVTDKNSWALGGGLAAMQTVESFMKGAANKVATQLRDAKTGKPTRKAR